MKDDLIGKAVKIVEEAWKENIILRVMGALAIRIHAPSLIPLHKKLERELTDIDLIGYRKQEGKVNSFFEKLGYHELRSMSPGLFLSRKIYYTDKGDHVDVFFDKIDMCHTIEFKGRLEVDFPTIPLAELVLEKLQIVKINEKDIKDMIVLLIDHDLGEGEDQVDVMRIANVLSKDWGFYYTVTTNLKKVKEFSVKYPVLSKAQAKMVIERVDEMLDAIETAPKSMGWKLRARVGPKKKWYRDVEEFERGEWLGEKAET